MNPRLLCCALLICVTAIMQLPIAIFAQEPMSLTNSEGLRLSISETDTQPALTIALPGEPSNQPAIRVLFPEHVTAKKKGNADAELLYLFRPGLQGEEPRWKRSRDSFGYERDFSAG